MNALGTPQKMRDILYKMEMKKEEDREYTILKIWKGFVYFVENREKIQKIVRENKEAKWLAIREQRGLFR